MDFNGYCLLEGLDDIGLTLAHEAEISAYESLKAAAWLLAQRNPAVDAANLGDYNPHLPTAVLFQILNLASLKHVQQRNRL